MFQSIVTGIKTGYQVVKNVVNHGVTKVITAVTGATLAVSAQAQAALSPADEALISAGITSSDAVFYKIAGFILVVLAGIWGFKKVRSMF